MQSSDSRGNGKSSGLWLRWLLGFLVGIFAFLYALEQVYNYDIWWHLRTGQLILDTGSVPSEDPFSYTTPGAAWVPHYWLSDLVFASVERVSDLDGLILFKALLVASAFALAYFWMQASGVDPFIASFLVGAAVPIARFRFMLRPGVFMLLLAVALVWRLSQVRRGEETRLWVLIPLLAIWANLHASFVLGIVLFGCLVFEEGLTQLRDLAGHRPTNLKPFWVLIGISIALVLATLVNPFGWNLHEWIIGDFVAKSVTGSFEIQEHLPLRWGDYELFWGLMILTGLSLVAGGRQTRCFYALVFLATSFLAVRSVRYIALAAILQAPILGIQLRILAERVSLGWPVSQRLRAMALLPLLLVLAAISFRASFGEEKVYRFGLGINESRFPIAATDFIEGLDLKGNLFNSWEFGGYLLWRFPERKNYMDGRCLDEQLRFHTASQNLDQEAFESLLERLDVSAALVLLQNRIEVGRFDHAPQFQVVFFDDQSLVYLRSDAGGEATQRPVIPFQLIRPADYGFQYLETLAKSPAAGAAEQELRRAVQLAPKAFKTHFLLGRFLETRGNPEAIDQYLEAASGNSRLAFVHYDLGKRGARLALANKRPEDAVRILDMAEPFGLDGEANFILGTAHYLLENLPEAERALKRSVSLSPESAEARGNLAYVYLDSQRYRKALKEFEIISQQAPEREEGPFGIALTLERSRQPEKARQAWRSFLERFPSSAWGPQARHHLRELEKPNSD